MIIAYEPAEFVIFLPQVVPSIKVISNSRKWAKQFFCYILTQILFPLLIDLSEPVKDELPNTSDENDKYYSIYDPHDVQKRESDSFEGSDTMRNWTDQNFV